MPGNPRKGKKKKKFPEGSTHLFSDIIALGKANQIPDTVLEYVTLIAIMYTSGTTAYHVRRLLILTLNALKSLLLKQNFDFSQFLRWGEETTRNAFDKEIYFRTVDDERIYHAPL
ncbi:MAG: hypothetical protein EZS28_000628 [Streblomastix strix]|uniref:Uncharacterized protein n=1 Tax=Streblomastix strix TaxID=222440 RepID=A0A5J4XBE5_9EUKA|nr:MAG: hypothetical protein EZS28_000628 [Streblomastix strix]